MVDFVLKHTHVILMYKDNYMSMTTKIIEAYCI